MPSPAMHNHHPTPDTRKKPHMYLTRFSRLLVLISSTLMTACLAVGIFEHEWLLAAFSATGLLINVLLWDYINSTD